MQPKREGTGKGEWEGEAQWSERAETAQRAYVCNDNISLVDFLTAYKKVVTSVRFSWSVGLKKNRTIQLEL